MDICTLESQSHVTHTLAFEKELSCHLSTLEEQFQIIYSFGKHSCAIFGMGTFFFLKGFLCYLSTNIHILKGIFTLPIHKYTFLKCIIYYSFTLQGIFMPYIHTLCNIFLCHIFTYIYTPLKKHLPRYLGAKCQSWGSSNPYKKSLFSCFSNPKTKFWIPSHKHVSLH